jgi:hypothetical protein
MRWKSDLKEGVGCGVWGVGKETSFISGGENFFIETDWKHHAAGINCLKAPQMLVLIFVGANFSHQSFI